jgi:hypothetical protein
MVILDPAATNPEPYRVVFEATACVSWTTATGLATGLLSYVIAGPVDVNHTVGRRELLVVGADDRVPLSDFVAERVVERSDELVVQVHLVVDGF